MAERARAKSCGGRLCIAAVFTKQLYFLGLLNSRLSYWYFAMTCAGLEGKNEKSLRFFGQYLEHFPIRQLDLTKQADKIAHDRMLKLVDSMQQLRNRLSKAKSAQQADLIQRQIDSTDAEVDRLVYDVYGLTDEEIAIVEGKV